MNGKSLGTMKFWDNQYQSECNYKARAAQGKSQELGGKPGAQWSAQSSWRTRVRQAAPKPHGRGRLDFGAHTRSRMRTRPPGTGHTLVRGGGLGCGASPVGAQRGGAPGSAEQRRAGRPAPHPGPASSPTPAPAGGRHPQPRGPARRAPRCTSGAVLWQPRRGRWRGDCFRGHSFLACL